jgi:hypothetical protein
MIDSLFTGAYKRVRNSKQAVCEVRLLTISCTILLRKEPSLMATKKAGKKTGGTTKKTGGTTKRVTKKGGTKTGGTTKGAKKAGAKKR